MIPIPIPSQGGQQLRSPIHIDLPLLLRRGLQRTPHRVQCYIAYLKSYRDSPLLLVSVALSY